MTELIDLQARVHELEIEHETKRAEAVEALRDLYETKEFWTPQGPLGQKYRNWADYVKIRFNYSKTYAYALLDFDRIRQDCIAQQIPPPAHESHTRAITQVVKNAARNNRKLSAVDIWNDVLHMSQADPEEITASTVDAVLAETGRAGAKRVSPEAPELQELRNRLTALLNCNAIAKYSGAELCRKHKLDPKLRAKVAEAWDRLGEILECG